LSRGSTLIAYFHGSLPVTGRGPIAVVAVRNHANGRPHFQGKKHRRNRQRRSGKEEAQPFSCGLRGSAIHSLHEPA
jgi:hypothetical protein